MHVVMQQQAEMASESNAQMWKRLVENSRPLSLSFPTVFAEAAWHPASARRQNPSGQPPRLLVKPLVCHGVVEGSRAPHSWPRFACSQPDLPMTSPSPPLIKTHPNSEAAANSNPLPQFSARLAASL